MRFLTLGLLLVSSAALGQTLTLTVNNVTDVNQTIGLNRDDCGTELPVIWTFSGATPCEPMSLWVTTATSCPKAPATGDLVLDSVSTDLIINRGSTDRDIAVSSLPVFTGDAGTCGSASVEQELRVCAFFKVRDFSNACNTEVTASSAPKLRFDTKPPSPPNIVEVTERDSALGVTVEGEEDSTIRVAARVVNADGTIGNEVASDETTSADGTATLEGLVNGTKYSVVATATDESDNTSVDSEAVEGTPVKSSGFFEEYVGAEGKETGGCGAAGGGIAGGAVLAALGFWLSRRKQS